MSDRWRCTWGKGCNQPIGLVEGRTRRLCYRHDKVVDGFLDAKDITIGPGAILAGVRRSDVVSDEQREIAHLLRKLGADDRVVRRALSKQLHSSPTSKATKGTGVKHGRISESKAW